MPKAYWVVCYRSVSNPSALAEYAKVAAPAIQAAGGHFLIRGTPTKTHEAGLPQRTVVVQFDSLDKAVTAYESDAYKKATSIVLGAAERDLRIIEGVVE